MKKYFGQQAIEFALILALVSVVAVAALFILGGKISALFSSINTASSRPFYSPIADQNPSGTLSTGTFSLPGDLPLSTDNQPQGMSCNNQSCSLSLGTLTLTNIEPDMTQVFQTMGASGGTEIFAGYLSQIAAQLETSGQIEASEDVKRLATLGHNVAVAQKAIDTIVSNCNYEENCISRALYNSTASDIPGFQPESIGIPPNTQNIDLLHETLLGTAKIEWSPSMLALRPNSLNKEMNKTLEVVLANPSLDSQSKSIIQELYWQLGMIGEKNESNIKYLMGASIDLDRIDDPLTGQSTLPSWNDDPIQQYKILDAPQISHYDSALICAAGKHHDSGESCH